jgi:hypothetical protein
MMKNKSSIKNLYFFIAFFCLGLLTFNFQRNNFLTLHNLRPVTDSDKFSMDVPPGWNKATRHIQDLTATVYMAPPADNFHPNINVLLDSGHGVSLDVYIAHNRETMKEAGMQLDSVNNYEVNGNKGKWFNVAYNYQGRLLALKSYIFMQNNVAYIVTCTCLDTQKSTYDIIFNNTLKTFKILN